MSLEATTTPTSTKFANRTITVGPIAKYHIQNVILLTAVPFLCGVVLLFLLLVFSKLNLFYLEANGLVVLEEVRDAYYSQVQTETLSVAGYLILQLAVTAVVSAVVMRWASAPFVNATHTLETALRDPANMKPTNRWLSESQFFDRVIWLFALRVKNGGENQVKDIHKGFPNLFFLVKFWITFGVLSIFTGYMMGYVISSVYDQVVQIALEVARTKSLSSSQHFFAAQQDILGDAIKITTIVSLVIYFAIGMRISRYMNTMIFVFARALEEDRFPVQLRTDDVYHSLGAVMNRAREKIR
jgi:hypothetical protein